MAGLHAGPISEKKFVFKYKNLFQCTGHGRFKVPNSGLFKHMFFGWYGVGGNVCGGIANTI